jgi:hypothetical protein
MTNCPLWPSSCCEFAADKPKRQQTTSTTPAVICKCRQQATLHAVARHAQSDRTLHWQQPFNMQKGRASSSCFLPAECAQVCNLIAHANMISHMILCCKEHVWSWLGEGAYTSSTHAQLQSNSFVAVTDRITMLVHPRQTLWSQTKHRTECTSQHTYPESP